VRGREGGGFCWPGGDLLSRVLRRSTIGAEGFDGRVRDGIGFGSLAMTTRPAKPASLESDECLRLRNRCLGRALPGLVGLGLSLQAWVWIKPIERLVPVGFAHCCASTSGLSTWWSSTALGRDLVLRGASRLDAFSGYPVRT
jgi:hypothetical protein